MIHNPLNQKKSRSKTPIFILGAIAVAVGVFIFKPTTHAPATIDTPVADIDNNKKEQIPATTYTFYDDELNTLIRRALTPRNFDQPLVLAIKQIKPVNAGIEQPSVLSQQNKVIALKTVSGDSLSTLFKKAGLSSTTMHKVLESSPVAKKRLTQLRIGQPFIFTIDTEGNLLSLVSNPNILETYSVHKQGEKYLFSQKIIKPTYQDVYARGVINSSLFVAADKANIPHKMIIEIANAFGYDIDFALDLRQGDEFEAIFEKKLVNGKVVGTGNLLAARFVNRGKEYTAVRYVNSKGISSYYRADGTSMRRAFIRTPVDFTRISSKFSTGRYHPVLNRIRAHTGVDYAAPTGTAIRASGDGRIVERGRKGGYGNAIVIQHGKSYTTLYAHMSRFAEGFKVGSHVKQGQTIGYVGMTGLATGPHLHYEFRVNGKHVDPLSIKLPMAEPLSGPEKVRFLKTSQPLMAKMSQNRNTMVASTAQKETDTDTQ